MSFTYFKEKRKLTKTEIFHINDDACFSRFLQKNMHRLIEEEELTIINLFNFIAKGKLKFDNGNYLAPSADISKSIPILETILNKFGMCEGMKPNISTPFLNIPQKKYSIKKLFKYVEEKDIQVIGKKCFYNAIKNLPATEASSFLLMFLQQVEPDNEKQNALIQQYSKTLPYISSHIKYTNETLKVLSNNSPHFRDYYKNKI